ncbi:MAG: alpha/beta fold hydrolase, partial [Turicibacter sp.]
MNLYVKVKPGVKIFIEDLNSTSEHVLFFIHGWPLNHNMWEYQIEHLTELGYRCITVDLRGFGQSDRPTTGYDYDTMASDIKTVIDALGLKDIMLIGHSMGGAIAIRYLSKYGAHGVSKLCLLSAAAPSFVRTEDWPEGFTVDQIDGLLKETYDSRPHTTSIIRNMFFYQ